MAAPGERALRDENFVTSLILESSSTAGSTVRARGDESTGRLLVDNSGGGSGTVTSISSGTGILLTPDPITTTGSVALVARIAPIATLGTAGQSIRVNAGATALEYYTPAAGTVTSVGFTGGLISVANPTTTPAFTVAGTSGGIPYFSSSSTWASSGVLAANAIVIGGGAGTTPATTTTGTGVLTALGINVGSAGAFVTFNGALGTPSSGVATNLTGTAAGLSIGGTAAIATTVTVADEAADTSCFVNFTTAATGNLGVKTNAGLTFNSSTGALTATSFVGSITGNAATVTTANEATDTSCFITFATAASGSLPVCTNTNMTFNSNTGVATFASTVLTTTDINGGTVDGTVIGGSSAAAGTFTLATAEGFSPTSSTATGNRMYLPAANTIGFAINGTGEIQIDSTAIFPIANDGSALGKSGTAFADLFLASGAVIDIAAGNWIATHTSGILTVGTGDLRVSNAGSNTASVVTVGGSQTLTSKTLTSPTIQTSPVLAAATQLKYTVASSDGTATGDITNEFNSGYSSTAFGDLVYLDSSATWQKADADAASTSINLLGIALTVAASGAPVTVLLRGFIYAASAFPTMTIGVPMYVGETAGAIQAAIPTGADNVIRVVGNAVHADKIWFNPSQDWQVTVA